ncbi:MAG: hypothetical protein QXU75_07210 [Candidatus Methanomethylicaceae archaeon]
MERTSFTGADQKGYSVVARDLVVSETLGFGFEPTNQHGNSDSSNKKFKNKKIRINGSIDLTGAKIGRNLLLDNLHIKGKTGSRRRSLVAPAIQVGGALLMRYTTVEGGVDLRTAKIEGIVSFHGSQLNYDETAQDNNQQKMVPFPSLSMRAASVGLDLLFGDEDYANCCQQNCFSAKRIRLDGIHVKGSLRFCRACIQGQLQAVGIQIDGDFEVRQKTRFEQTVRLDGAEIKGNLDCRGGTFKASRHPDSSGYKSPENYCFYAPHVSVGQNIHLGVYKESPDADSSCFSAEGAVNFADARVGRLFDCRGGQFLHEGDRCLFAPRIEVGGDMNLCISSVDVTKRFLAKGTVRIAGARIRGDLDCGAAQLEGKNYSLYAPGIRVDGSIYLNADALWKTSHLFEAAGCVRLDGATIGRNLDCRGGIFHLAPEKETNFDIHEYALYAANIQIRGDVYLSIQPSTKKRFHSHGPVNFAAATVDGKFDCRGGFFGYSGKRCLYAPLLEVGRRMYLSAWIDKTSNIEKVYHFYAEGTVHLSNAKISGDLDCGGGYFAGSYEYSIVASDITVGGTLYMGQSSHGQACFCAWGCVRLDGASIGLNWDCNGGVFGYLTRKSFDQRFDPQDYCLYAMGLTVTGNVSFGISTAGKRFCAVGPVSLERAKVSGNLDCRGGIFLHHGKYCFCAPQIEVGHAVLLGVAHHDTIAKQNTTNFSAYGTIDLTGASVGGDVEFGGAELGKGKLAKYSLYAVGMQIQGNMCLNSVKVSGKCHQFSATGCVRLDGSKIQGNLDCRGGNFLLSLPQRDALNVDGTQQTLCDKSQTPYIDAWVYSLYAPNIEIGGNLYCGIQADCQETTSNKNVRFSAEGPVSFAAAKISGHIDCSGGDFRHTGSRCLYAPQIEVMRRVKLGYDPDVRGLFKAKGTVQLQGATIHGDFDCGGGCFKAGESFNDVPENCALHAPGLKIGGNVYLNKYPKTRIRFYSKGDVIIEASTVAGNIEAEGGKIENGGLTATDITVGRSVYLGSPPSEGENGLFTTKTVNLSKADIGHSLEVYGTLEEFDLSNATVKGSFIFAAGGGSTPHSLSESDVPHKHGSSPSRFTSVRQLVSKMRHRIVSMLTLIGVVRFEQILRKVGGSGSDSSDNQNMSLKDRILRKISWIILGKKDEIHLNTSCFVRINLQNASVDLWDDQYVFPKSGEENPNHTPFLCKMGREQILRAAAYDLSGFTYSTLGEHLLECIRKFPREVGLWLNFSKICTYDPQPYEHMAEVLKKHGEEAGYAAIVVAKRREHRQYVDPDGYLRWTIALVSLFGLILSGLLFPKHINLNPYWMSILGVVGVVSMIFYLSARFLFKVLGLAFDFVFLHFPVHLIERPWRAPAYATVIWLTFSLSYAAIDAKKFMAPSEGHLQYYLTEGDKHYKELADLEREQSKRLDEILSVLSTQSDTSEKRVQGSNTPSTHAESHNEVSKQSKADAEWNPPKGYPEYNPFLYTLDRLAPFVEFAQSDAWIPDSSKTQGKILWYTDWFLRITGFYLITVLLGAVTGLVKAEKL